jgi:DNA polymerase delta subunit 1
MLIINKKRYAGDYFGDKQGRYVEGAEEPDEPDMIYERGIETIRRDVCPLVSETLSAVNFFLLWRGDVQKAKQIVRQVVCDLYMCRVPIAKITLCKVSARSARFRRCGGAHAPLT